MNNRTMISGFAATVAAGLMAAVVASPASATQYDANIATPPGVYFGAGNNNGHFTIETFGTDGELALRGHQRYQDTTTPTGNTYTVALGQQASFDFSFNPFTTSIDGLAGLLTITNLRTGGTASYDPFNVLFGNDHPVVGSPAAQNSEYLGFGFLNGSVLGNINYNANIDTTYRVAFTVSGTNFATVTDSINIQQGAGGVPEPATWGLMIMGFGGIGALLRRSRRAAAFA